MEGVTRIDVIPRDGALDHLGRQSIPLSGIVLTWPREPGRGLVAWGCHMRTGVTFHHEVGHHALGHLEGGQVPEQDKRAHRTLGRAHPVQRLAVRAPFRPSAPWMRRRRGKRRHHAG